MNKKLLVSIVSLVAVLGLGVGATYALFTSNTVTIANNTLTTGEATIKLCNSIGSSPSGANSWKSSINPSFVVTGLVPGGAEKELTAGSYIYLGNDSGDLANNLGSGWCTSYDGATGSSDVPMQMVPVVNTLVCNVGGLENQLELKFEIAGNDTGYASLSWWTTNASTYLPTFDPDGVGRVKMYTKLDSVATDQNANCTFNVTFTGKQV